MFNFIADKIYEYALTMRSIDTLEINRFLLRHLKYHILNTRIILTPLITCSVVGFSILTSESVYLFIPQTTVGAFASFMLFVLLVSILTFILFPLVIIYLVNILTGLFKSNSWLKISIKLITLGIAFAFGINSMAQQTIDSLEKLQIVVAWISIYLLIINRYLAHLRNKEQSEYNRPALIIMVLIFSCSIKPFLTIYTHTLESLNITNVNPQVYLTWPNCRLLRNLNLSLNLTESNDTLNNNKYYSELKDNQGCFIYGNTIRYSFGYDYTLVVKRNITPLVDNHGVKYNAYVRLNCFAGNCYSDNNMQYKANEDIFAGLIKNGEKLDRTF